MADLVLVRPRARMIAHGFDPDWLPRVIARLVFRRSSPSASVWSDRRWWSVSPAGAVGRLARMRRAGEAR